MVGCSAGAAAALLAVALASEGAGAGRPRARRSNPRNNDADADGRRRGENRELYETGLPERYFRTDTSAECEEEASDDGGTCVLVCEETTRIWEGDELVDDSTETTRGDCPEGWDKEVEEKEEVEEEPESKSEHIERDGGWNPIAHWHGGWEGGNKEEEEVWSGSSSGEDEDGGWDVPEWCKPKPKEVSARDDASL